MKIVSRPEPNRTPEAAMELPLQKARLVFGEWSAGEYGSNHPRVIAFARCDGVWTRHKALDADL